MTKRHFLTCTCGVKRLIESSQAGERLACSACGADLDVPTLRRLRDLPVAEEVAPGSRLEFTWTPLRGGVFLTGILITVISVASMLMLTVTGLNESAVANVQPNEELGFKDLADLTPQEAWLEWQTLRRLPPRRIAMRQRSEFPWEYYRQIAGGFALAGVAISVLAWIVRPQNA